MEQITSSKNPIIKKIKGLFKKKDRWQNKLFIIEGIKLIDEALNNDVSIEYILYSDKLLNTSEGALFLEKIGSYGKAINISDSIFKEISDTENTQGILAIVGFNIRPIHEIFVEEKKSFIYLNGLQDPGNMGTIIRSADAFNIDGIILGEGCVDPYNPKVVRATMGSIFRTPLYFVDNDKEILTKIKESKYKLYATHLEGSIPNYDLSYRDKFVVVIGNESRGVDDNVIDMADGFIKIPMPGFAESLNAGVAASIIMYEVMKQRAKNS